MPLKTRAVTRQAVEPGMPSQSAENNEYQQLLIELNTPEMEPEVTFRPKSIHTKEKFMLQRRPDESSYREFHRNCHIRLVPRQIHLPAKRPIDDY